MERQTISATGSCSEEEWRELSLEDAARDLMDVCEVIDGLVAILEDAKVTPQKVRGLAVILKQTRERIAMNADEVDGNLNPRLLKAAHAKAAKDAEAYRAKYGED